MTSRIKSTNVRIFHETSFYVTFSDNSNGLASTNTCTYSSNKQGKRYSIHKLPLHLPDQTNQSYGDILYKTSKRYGINAWLVFEMQLIGGGGREPTNILGVLNFPSQGLIFF